MRYDPTEMTDAAEWLEADEGERLLAVQAYHEQAGIALPSVRAHAIFHVVAENQLAEGYASAVRALERLTGEGLDRHDAIHAIGTLLARHMHDLLTGTASSFDDAAYARDLDALKATAWRAGRV